MVKRCRECDEYAFATRFKDSYMMFCRACGYYTVADSDDEGYLDEERFSRLREQYPLHGYQHAPPDADPDLWSDGGES